MARTPASTRADAGPSRSAHRRDTARRAGGPDRLPPAAPASGAAGRAGRRGRAEGGGPAPRGGPGCYFSRERTVVVSFLALAAPLSLPAVDITVTTAPPERAAMSVVPFCQVPLVRVSV